MTANRIGITMDVFLELPLNDQDTIRRWVNANCDNQAVTGVELVDGDPHTLTVTRYRQQPDGELSVPISTETTTMTFAEPFPECGRVSLP